MSKSSIILVISIIFILIASFINESHLFSNFTIYLYIIALVGGIIFEYVRLSDNLKETFVVFLQSFFVSFAVFIPGKHEGHYNIKDHFELWPYMFCLIFILGAMVKYKDKIIPKINEGVTLIQSMAVIYLVFHFGFFAGNNILIEIAMCIGIIFSIFSIYHAFTNKELTNNNKFVLSVWSSLVMMLLSAYHIYAVYKMGVISTIQYTSNDLFYITQYFLLGISSIYFMQNFFLLISLLPGKRGNDRESFQDAKNEHIARFSDFQIHKTRSLIIVAFTIFAFGYNYFTQSFPPNLIIWAILVLFPLILNRDIILQQPLDTRKI
jgi:hypothetical protein